MVAKTSTPETTPAASPTPAKAPTGDTAAAAAALRLERLLTTDARAFKFVEPGDTVVGVINEVVVRQTMDFKTKQPVWWKGKNGEPDRMQEQIVLTIDTDLDEVNEEYPEDDGERAVYIKGWGPQKRSFIKAVKSLKRMPAVGDTVQLTFTGLSVEVDKDSGQPWKEFVYSLTAP